MAMARRFAELFDAPIVRSDADSADVSLGAATLELVTAVAWHARLGELGCSPIDADGQPRTAYMAMVTIATESLEKAAGVLAENGFSAERFDATTLTVLTLPAAETMNCSVGFTV